MHADLALWRVPVDRGQARRYRKTAKAAISSAMAVIAMPGPGIGCAAAANELTVIVTVPPNPNSIPALQPPTRPSPCMPSMWLPALTGPRSNVPGLPRSKEPGRGDFYAIDEEMDENVSAVAGGRCV